MYNNGSLVSKFNELTQKNLEVFSDKSKVYIRSIEALINIQSQIASYFIGFWLHPISGFGKGRLELMPLLFSLFLKNVFSFYSVVNLTLRGLYGPSRPLLRHIFESQMISKFCHICNDDHVLKKWTSGETIYFTNSILRKIIIPDPRPFSEFWTLICDYSHATRFSGQVTLETEEIQKNVVLNMALMGALLECNYHLLNSHLITPELDYTVRECTKRSEPKIRDYEIPELRKKAHLQFKKNRDFLGSDSIKLISAYKRKWIIKT